MVYFWGVNLSVAVAVGFIALFGIAVETGIVMVIYLNDAMQQLVDKKGNSRETISKITGVTRSICVDEVSTPPIIGSTMGSITSLPTPDAHNTGTSPNKATDTVINLGRSLVDME